MTYLGLRDGGFKDLWRDGRPDFYRHDGLIVLCGLVVTVPVGAGIGIFSQERRDVLVG